MGNKIAEDLEVDGKMKSIKNAQKWKLSTVKTWQEIRV